jgi:hypothetical protein
MVRLIPGLVKRGVAAAAVAVAVLAMTGAPATAHHPPLSPSPYCTGSQVGSYHTHGGQITVFVHYSSANGGTNCVWAQKNVNRGTAQWMELEAFGYCRGNECLTPQHDRGSFRYYAGPLTATHLAGRCIEVSVRYSGSWAHLGPFHCG